MNKTNWIFSILIFMIPLCFLFFLNRQTSHTAYIDLEVVFAEFNGKKEMEAAFMNGNDSQRVKLDSMAIEIKAMNARLTNENGSQAAFADLQAKQNFYVKKANEFSEQSSFQESQITEKIWSQINQYVYDFGESHGFDFIYGLNRTGNLMFAKKDKDITKEVIEYINKRYEGL